MEDDEDDDSAEDSDGAGDENSSIGDMDGLAEQVGCRLYDRLTIYGEVL
jgi:hypothetical protein